MTGLKYILILHGIDAVHAYCCKWRLKANVSKVSTGIEERYNIMVMLSGLNNLAFTLQLGILGKLVKGCVREVNLAQVGCILIMLLRPHQWVRGRWPWGYGSVLSIIIMERRK